MIVKYVFRNLINYIKYFKFNIKFKYFILTIYFNNTLSPYFTKKILCFNSRNEMIKFFCDKSTNLNLLEIGVFKGEFLNFINTQCKNVNKIDALDLFEGIVFSGDVDGNNLESCDLVSSYKELKNLYNDNFKINIIKSDSYSFLKIEDNNFYDIIYIDGDHSYEGVMKDLIGSYNKIKDRGYIMGHDYIINTRKTKNFYHFGVKKAVDKFCVVYKQKVTAYSLDGYVSFCIQINKK